MVKVQRLGKKQRFLQRLVLFTLTFVLTTHLQIFKNSASVIAQTVTMETTKIHTHSGEEQQVIQAINAFLNSNQQIVEKFGPGKITELAVIPPFGLAKFEQGPAGGYIVVKRQDETWQIVTRRDDWGGLKSFVETFGIPEPIAIQLLDQMFPDWRQLER